MDIELPDFNTQYTTTFPWLYPQGVISNKSILYNKIFLVPCVPLPKNFDFNKVSSLSTEAREKLNKIRPGSIGQASRISGVSAADVSVLTLFLRT
jgi:tRNA uridine 5-carboxymethylaminomethyl modification enzyme